MTNAAAHTSPKIGNTPPRQNGHTTSARIEIGNAQATAISRRSGQRKLTVRITSVLCSPPLRKAETERA